MNSVISFIHSIGNAWRGVRLAFATERSFRIQIAAALAICVLLLVLPLREWERVALVMATMAVLVLELVNSMVERLVDLVKPRLHGYVKDIKDLMAAAVFIASFAAALIGVMIFYPYVSDFIGRL